MKQPKDGENYFTGRRVLICQPIMHGFGGSTVCTLELAEYLMSVGCRVEIYTLTYGPQLREICERLKVAVHTAEEQPQLSLWDYDLIWVHSEVLPQTMIAELPQLEKAASQGREMPYWVFAHLSPLEDIPDEWPWNEALEDKVADIVLYVSEATREKQRGTIGQSVPIGLFRNPVLDKFVRAEVPGAKELESVLVVSNHVSQEVWEAIDLLRGKGIRVDVLGVGGERRLVKPEDLFGHDVVVTIGKTVQYAFAAQTPVYIYDHWGGGGYLNKKNYALARRRNFSGRGFGSKTAQQIADEIVGEFSGALMRQNEAIAEDWEEYLMGSFLVNLMCRIEHRAKEGFSERQIKTMAAAQRICEYRFLRQMWLEMAEEREGLLREENERLRAEVKEYERTQGVKGAAKNLLRAGKTFVAKRIRGLSK